MSASARVELAHHWLVNMRGGEKVLEQFCLLFPRVPISTLVATPGHLSPLIQRHPIRTSLLQHLGGPRFYKQMMPLFPLVIPQLRCGSPGGLVLSTDASVIKGLRIPPGVPHVCYCHSPPRYLWDLQKTYEEQSGGLGALARLVFRSTVPYVREFDRRAAQRVDEFIANSEFVKSRIRHSYGRDAVVIHPPVDVDAFVPNRPRTDTYLIVSHLVPYKRVDIAVDAFTRLGKPLVVIGEGSELKTLQARAGANVRFLGSQPFSVLKDHYETCRAFVFPGIEDFGITPLEAQSAGAPVIAFRAGGAVETVVENETGRFFDEQTPEALAAAVTDFECSGVTWDPATLRRNALRFRPGRFRAEIRDFLTAKYPKLFENHPWPDE